MSRWDSMLRCYSVLQPVMFRWNINPAFCLMLSVKNQRQESFLESREIFCLGKRRPAEDIYGSSKKTRIPAGTGRSLWWKRKTEKQAAQGRHKTAAEKAGCVDQPSHADAGREFTAFEISGTTDKQIIKETRKKTAVWVCLRCMPYPGRGAVKMYCIIYNYGKMLLFPIIYGNVICAVWRRRMDNISFYHRNRKKQVWKAGQSERLPGFSGCRFCWYMRITAS
ncbi:hypothetical protein C823_005264 [Eubacterium plexicaudatum ASF492]|nr:hypothetical protein C823_005264 [Eubacterium plexicaudatum ASF492]